MEELISLLSKYRDDVNEMMQDKDLLFIDTVLLTINDNKYDFYKFDRNYLLDLLDSSVSEEELDIIYVICNGRKQGIDTSYDDLQLSIVRRIVDKLKIKRNEIDSKYVAYRENIDIANAFISALGKGELPYVSYEFFDSVFKYERVPYAKACEYLILLLQKNEEIVKEEQQLLDENYQYIFDYYKLDSDLFLELVDKYNVDELNKLFSLFDKIIKIRLCNNNEMLRKILLNTSVKRLEDIIEIGEKNNIPLSDLAKHPNLLVVSDDNKEYKNFVYNISIVLEMKMNVASVFKSNYSLLVMDYKLLLKNVRFYSLYGLDINYNKDKLSSTCLSGLCSNNVLDNMDRFIEMGAYDYIKQNQSRLKSHDALLFYKGYYAMKHGIGFINSFANTGKLYMENSTLNGLGINKDNYMRMTNCINPYIDNQDDMMKMVDKNSEISDMSINYDDILYGLEEYRVNDVLYDIEGVLVSRLKVIRIFRSLEDNNDIDIKNKLMFALCYKKIMNNDDYEVLNKIVNQLVEERKR